MYLFILLSLYVSSIWASPSIRHPMVPQMDLQGPRIINGQEAQPGQFPWQVEVYVTETKNGQKSFWFCGGAIINEEWILTAAHCIFNGEAGQIVSGSVSRSKGVHTEVAEFKWHEDYTGKSLTNDIGLVKLKTPLKFDDNTAPIALSSDNLDAGVEVTVSGWGYTQDSSTVTDSLNFVNLITISNAKCNQVYGTIQDTMVCSNSGSNEVKGICNGDSGGPLVVNADSNPVHVGIVSFHGGCKTNNPSGFTRTASYRGWIKEKTGT